MSNDGHAASLANIEAFVRSAEHSSFAEAARRLALTPAAVSRNVAALESSLGIRLFQRAARTISLTPDGVELLQAIEGSFTGMQQALERLHRGQTSPKGLLRVGMGLTMGVDYILPALPEFLERHPGIDIDWHFENREIDLVGEGFDVTIGASSAPGLGLGLAARVLAPAHLVAVASPTYMKGRPFPLDPKGLTALDAVVMRCEKTGRVRPFTMRNAAGTEVRIALSESIVVSDPMALCRCATLGMGVALVALADATPHLKSGALVRVAPHWYADDGLIAISYAKGPHVPPRTRLFVDHIWETFQRERYAERLAGVGGG